MARSGLENTKKILVVDDDAGLLAMLQEMLRFSGFDSYLVQNGGEALRTIYHTSPDLVILDVVMEPSGIELCRRIREMSNVPIIMLTGLNDTKDLVRAFSAGADDFISKPFSMAELMARVQALFRRAESGPIQKMPSVLAAGSLFIDPIRHRATLDGAPLKFTPTEFKLLVYLARHKGEVIPHNRLLAEVWGPEYIDQLDYLRLYIRYLRKKLEKDPSEPRILMTERGIGYYLNAS